MNTAIIIGAGPAGLMAAEELAKAGVSVTVCEAKPSVGRKFLMAGKSGLNITKDEAPEQFLAAFTEASPHLAPMIAAFGPNEIKLWAAELGQELFTGSTGRVFPKAMKASPLLRAWLGRLDALGVTFNTRWRWTGWSDGGLRFDTPEGVQTLGADVTIFALGGASWKRLGSDGVWAEAFQAKNVPVTPFSAANAGIKIDWSSFMEKHFGFALKGIALSSGPFTSRGEAVISRQGIEGGGVYSVSRGVRDGHQLVVDLAPDQTLENIGKKLSKPQGKATLTNHMRKVLKLDPAKIALLQEMAKPLPKDPKQLAKLIKAVPVQHSGLRPMDEAISTAGGVAWSGVDETLMLQSMPATYVVGEMLDWEAPTGGYLITACLATGAWAGRHAAAKIG
ncbi:TIGR03862 family flavoprotein [Sulfitobacter donghicola]|uniref:NAD(FAD)-utilizing dehydrogenase n=1 Tax=Sulfitobacter donghicola DSW-25 = KCTC 12864 = JCM 14565 TaxID=1300350 RepID=A0A073ILH9_9RHOB|nr:TIGR03862 family flavoprotein [Sulfitobacter donghicola]KEJ90435.1 NAD(FAD)-utilizing dehydrogenase [Sulfitobacter donghicola DSW-25 = KCTC 12864 = JCM 14565]KIN67666.1 Flavoprotein [Sulfitobacter donghicola DSW-25 = KCTC 12864 = JCM 14565]